MNRKIEKTMAARAVDLGNSGNGSALPELAGLLGKPSVEVRRLAASAIGKLAGAANSAAAVTALVPVLRDSHPQVRQYAVKALSAYGAAAETALPDLHDIGDNPAEKDYNKRDAAKTVAVIQEAMQVVAEQAEHCCQRCSCKVDADEYARSQKTFQRVFCDRCFDEVYLDRRNFDTKVELNKTIRAKDGTLVQSHGERIIVDFLDEHGIAFRYDERFRIIEGFAIRPDFYLPEFDVYIEYWGMDTTDYKIGMLKKKKLYQQEGKRIISLYPVRNCGSNGVYFSEKKRLREVLTKKLRRYVGLPDACGTECSQEQADAGD